MSKSTNARRKKRLKLNLSTAAMGVFAFIFSFPFIWMTATSLKPTNEVFSTGTSLFASRLEWSNYEMALTSIPFMRIVFNSLFVAVLGALLTVTVSLLSAYAFSRFRFKYRDHLFGLFIVTLVLPQEVLIIPLYIMMYQAGLIDSYFALIVPMAFGAFGAFLIRQFMLSIPVDYEDAARIDGANNFQILTKILLPLLKAPLWVVGVFAFIHYWSDFLWPLIVINNPDMATLPLGLSMFNSQFGTQWGPMMAAAVMAIIPSLFIVTFLQRQLEGGALSGAFGGR